MVQLMSIPGSSDYLLHRFNGSLSFAITLRVMWRGREVPDSPLLGREQKSAAISWNERDGRFFSTMGSGGWDGR